MSHNVHIYSENPSLVQPLLINWYDNNFAEIVVCVPDKYCEITTASSFDGVSAVSWEVIYFEPSYLPDENGIDLINPPPDYTCYAIDNKKKHPDYYCVGLYVRVPMWRGTNLGNIIATKHEYMFWIYNDVFDQLTTYYQFGNHGNYFYL